MIEARPLKQALLDHYGHFADKRIKNIDRGTRFIVDDRGPGDFGADRQLFLWFCQIWVDVTGPASLQVTMYGGVPKGASVGAWTNKHVARKNEGETSGRLVFDVAPDNQEKLLELAVAFRSIVRPDAPRYAEKAYKYVCPRTAAALEKLLEVLVSQWT